jgi:hypothetical protein
LGEAARLYARYQLVQLACHYVRPKAARSVVIPLPFGSMQRCPQATKILSDWLIEVHAVVKQPLSRCPRRR